LVKKVNSIVLHNKLYMLEEIKEVEIQTCNDSIKLSTQEDVEAYIRYLILDNNMGGLGLSMSPNVSVVLNTDR